MNATGAWSIGPPGWGSGTQITQQLPSAVDAAIASSQGKAPRTRFFEAILRGWDMAPRSTLVAGRVAQALGTLTREMRTKLCAASLLSLVSCSPPPAQPPRTTVAPRPPSNVPPEPRGARWTFFGEGAVLAEDSLPGGATLRAGEMGRRWIVRPGAAIEDAPQLAPADLVDVRREADGVLFLDERGGAHLAPSALASFTRSHAGPKAELRAVAAGKLALLAVEAGGMLHRSVDGGATWKVVPLAVRAGETAVSLVANRRAEALILLYPQRVLASTDDGATWSVVATPGLGARELVRDVEGTLWLRGAGGDPPHARYAGGKLELSGLPVTSPHQDPPPRAMRTIAGERLITRTLKAAVASVSVAPLGSTPLARSFPAPGPVHFTGAGSTIVAAVAGESTPGSAHGPKTLLFRTTDDGVTWEPVGSFDGATTWGRSVIVAPRWIAIGEVCPDGAPTCTPPRVKLGSEDWQPLSLPSPKVRVHTARWDAVRERIIAYGYDANAPVLLRAAPTETALTRVDAALPWNTSLRAMTIGSDGSVRMVFDATDDSWELVRVAPDLGTTSTTYLPFGNGSIDLAGDRGFAISEGRAFETADGGAHWTDVGASDASSVECNDAGCLVEGGVRVGWELAAGASGGVAAQSSKPAPKAPPKGAPHAITCVASGAWKNVTGEMPWSHSIGLDHDVRYLAPPPPDLYVPKPHAVTFARGGELPKILTLMLAPPESAKNVRRWSETSSAGHVYIRYAFAAKNNPEDKYNPVDVDLSWLSARTGKVAKAKLAKVPPFRVGSESKSALSSIVDGGLLFMPFTGDTKLHWFRDDGKVETFPRPPHVEGTAWWDEGWKRGDTIVLAGYDGPDVMLVGTTDAGKSWKTATWTLGEDNVRLVDVGKRAALSIATRANDDAGLERPVGYLPFDVVTPDPVELVPAKRSELTGEPSTIVCTPAGREGARSGVSLATTISVTGKGEPTLELTGEVATARTSPEGTCVASIFAAADGDEVHYVALVAPHDPTHAVLLRAKLDDPFEHAARPMSCTLK